jgi:hypothetical protein
LPEFLAHDRVKLVGQEIERAVTGFLASVDNSWAAARDHAFLVLTGGGANLPMTKELKQKIWQIGGSPVRFEETPAVPELIVEQFDAAFQREYQQLAVAIGGALPVLEEGEMYKKCPLGAPPPGPVERW